ncbi:probable proteasome inhibitor [Diospyros lotus]|uniref:probable proteasome inhibitor n=1 Tax=Diospyros lotus TaxID=55363 RepID=UPI00224CE142|nr:probable proteasome inhibitor [Diospyros lotus]XP_052176783.1 probable proteasome inhibitor [Diospyros lotus]XP_052176784.1 probable proteasome inhibitor [Diospyros lotus]
MATEQSVLAVIRAARPTFRNAHDKMAFAVHAAFSAAGYVLHDTGPSAFSDHALSSSSTDEVGIDQWNEFEDSYAFLYSSPDGGSKKLLVKCVALNDKLLVDALSDGASSEPLHLEINIEDHDKENGGSNYGSQYKNLEKLVSSIDEEILSKLNGASRQISSTEPSSSRTRDVRVTEPRHPQRPYPTGYVYPPVPPTVGGSDLFPGPGAGMYPGRGDFTRGGMFVGPDHPIFGGMRGQPGLPGGLPGLPPGARFDPYGPPGVPGFEPNRFIRDPRGPRGGSHPDLEHHPDGSDFI